MEESRSKRACFWLVRVLGTSFLGLGLCIALAAGTSAVGQVLVSGGSCVLVDGKPFFPVGLYSAGGERDFPIIREAGFNTVHTYTWEGRKDDDWGKEWLDAVHENGLMALVGLYRPDVRAMDFEDSVRRIESFKNHPALLAWHTMDEPAWDKEGDQGESYMPKAYEIIKAHDPGHPVTAVVCHFSDTELFEPSVDVLQADYYPIPPIPADWYSGTGFRGIKLFVDKWRDASKGEKPFWYVGQIFDFSHQKEKNHDVPEEWQRLPTGEEVRCMTYTAIASGARGIFYWSLSRLIGDDWNRGLLPRVVLWEELKETVAEVNQLMPVLTSDGSETIQEENGVVVMVKGDGEHTYIIAANYERKPSDLGIRVPGVNQARAERVFRTGSDSVDGELLSTHFEPLEVKVYHLRDKTEQ